MIILRFVEETPKKTPAKKNKNKLENEEGSAMIELPNVPNEEDTAEDAKLEEEQTLIMEFLSKRIPEVKNHIGYLNEYLQKKAMKTEYIDHEITTKSKTPKFRMSARAGTHDFPVGQGRTKKKAKEAATRLALHEIFSDVNFEETVLKKMRPTDADKTGSPAAGAGAVAADEDDEICITDQTKQLIESMRKNAVQIIVEFCSKKYKHPCTFVEGVDVGDMTPTGKFNCRIALPSGAQFPLAWAKSKKNAKKNAALLALDELVTTNQLNMMGTGANAELPLLKLTNIQFTNDVFGLVGQYIHKTLISLVEKVKNPQIAESGKIIAGIVMMDDSNREAFVISLATGNRCLKGDLVSTNGEVLNDCHAEILARRGFKKFLLQQVVDYASYLAGKTSNKTIFMDSYSARNKLAVRKNYSFHLYINTAPCGDGRVFTSSEPEGSRGVSDPNIHRPIFKDPKKHGVLRSKIEKGEGTIPVGEIGLQTMDGIGGGERLRTMSCSDKVLMWNVMGLQGCLLSLFMEPVYLSSVTIGSLSHHGHLSRALCCRAGELKNWKEWNPHGPFQTKHPHLGHAGGQTSVRDTSKSSPISINWNFIDQTVEIVDGTTGRVQGNSGMDWKHLNTLTQSSRLCKREMMNMTKRVMTAYGQTNAIRHTEHYRDVKKRLGKDYYEAKNKFQRYLKSQGYGNWLKRPVEEQMFC